MVSFPGGIRVLAARGAMAPPEPPIEPNNHLPRLQERRA